MKKRIDIYQQVTDRIVDGLKEKGLAWFKPWATNGTAMLPINNATGRRYNGVNILFLSWACEQKGYEHNEWLTYKQADAKGGQVRKGEKGTPVIFWNISLRGEDGKFYKKVQDVPPGMAFDKIFSPRAFNVFNIGQCDGLEPQRKPVEPVGEFTPIKRAEGVYEGYPAKVRPTLGIGGQSAFYSPKRHHVQMPKPETFVSADDYYKTLFHELVHSTGHESCLKRKEVVHLQPFGTQDYSKEELVAEIGSNFLVGITGIEPKDNEQNSQAYINGWIVKLQEQPKMALSAATRAMKAVDFILGEEA